MWFFKRNKKYYLLYFQNVILENDFPSLPLFKIQWRKLKGKKLSFTGNINSIHKKHIFWYDRLHLQTKRLGPTNFSLNLAIFCSLTIRSKHNSDVRKNFITWILKIVYELKRNKKPSCLIKIIPSKKNIIEISCNATMH